MAKVNYKNRELFGTNAVDVRKAFMFFYVEKFYNKFYSMFEFDGLNYQQINYLIRKFWSTGTLACFRQEYTDGIDDSDVIVFAPWVFANKYNVYGFPTDILLINERAVSFIPTSEQRVDEDAVIGWIQPNHKSVYSMIEPKIKELVDIEMTMRTNMKASKTPWIFGISPENENAVKKLAENLEADNPNIFIPLEAVEKTKTLSSGSGFIVDKLEQQRQKIENDILTILGCNNVGIAEKKEHLIVDEINANNEQIDSYANMYLTYLKEFFERIAIVLGYQVNVRLKSEQVRIEEKDGEDYEEDSPIQAD